VFLFAKHERKLYVTNFVKICSTTLWQRSKQCSTQNLYNQSFFSRFRDPIRVSRISNRVPRIRQNYHRVLTNPNRVPNIFLKHNPDIMYIFRETIHFSGFTKSQSLGGSAPDPEMVSVREIFGWLWTYYYV